MSIYATIGSVLVATGRARKRCDRPDLHAGWDGEYAEVYFQAVPGHIDYDWDWLPPPVEDRDWDNYRAVVVCGPYSEKDGQRYERALMTLTGEEWRSIPFSDLWRRIEDALAAHMKAGRP